jgi:hypothetical protein
MVPEPSFTPCKMRETLRKRQKHGISEPHDTIESSCPYDSDIVPFNKPSAPVDDMQYFLPNTSIPVKTSNNTKPLTTDD